MFRFMTLPSVYLIDFTSQYPGEGSLQRTRYSNIMSIWWVMGSITLNSLCTWVLHLLVKLRYWLDAWFFFNFRPLLVFQSDEIVTSITVLNLWFPFPDIPSNSFHLLNPKLELSLMDNIKHDIDFCVKLTREENLVLRPGKVN